MKRMNFSQIWRYAKSNIPFFHTKRSQYPLCTTDLINHPSGVDEFERRMIGIGYQYNYFSYTEDGQISNMRKLYMDGTTIRQRHVRLFNDGCVYAHDELAYEHDAIGHINAVTLDKISFVEQMLIMDTITESDPE